MPDQSTTLSCFFVSDLHGKMSRYEALSRAIRDEKPDLVFIGGDLLPHARMNAGEFISDYLPKKFNTLRKIMGAEYPQIVMIPGNDDPAEYIPYMQSMEQDGIWKYLHMNVLDFREYTICGYAMVPPTPFLNKDWEKYDVSRYVDPGCVEPEQGYRSIPPAHDPEYSTIQKDLEELTKGLDPNTLLMLFHSPPYKSYLDRAALDGRFVDHVPLDVHVGSIAIQRFIEERQPLLTLHGHIHESASLTGQWYQHFQKTLSINAAHHGPELALIRFTLPSQTLLTKTLIP